MSNAARREKEAEALKIATSAEKIQSAKSVEVAYEAEKQAEVARSNREKATLEADVIVKAEIEKRKIELDAEAEAERMRRKARGEADVTLTRVDAEAEQIRRKARGEADVTLTKIDAEAEQIRRKAHAEADATLAKIDAETAQIRKKAEAEADAVFAKMDAEARGTQEILLKQATGLVEIVKAAGGNADDALKLMLTDKMEDLLRIQVDAVKNIKIDKVTVWENGGEKDGKTATANFLSGMMKSIPPLNEMFDMTGMKLPTYFGETKENIKENEQP
jgi:flotillin